jgi:hypothetical protein
MFKTNFYTGETSVMGNGEQYTSEAEATLNAGFGQYAQQYIPPTTYGLGGNVYQQQYGYPQQQYYQNPYMAQPNMYGQQQAWGNPALQGGYVNQNQQQQYSQIYIPPMNLSGNDYLLPADFENIAQDMLMQYYQERAEYEGKQIADRAKAKREHRYNPYQYNGYGYNYYGSPLYGSPYQTFHSKVFDQLNEIKDAAKKARVDLSINLSKLAHKTIGDNISDKDIETMYNGKYIDVENTVYACSEQDAFQARFTSDRFVPIDPGATPYRQYYDNTKEKIQSILPQDTTIEEFGSRMNILLSEWELEEMLERRRGFDQSYDSSAYKRLLKEKCAEKEANKQGFSLIRSDEPTQITKIKEQISLMEQTKNMTPEEKTRIMKKGLAEVGLPLMSDAVYFDEEGTMCLRANIGNHLGEMYTVSNENEAAYANKRAAFAGFLDSIPRSEELHDQKIEQYNEYSKSEFEYNMTHPPSSGGG